MRAALPLLLALLAGTPLQAQWLEAPPGNGSGGRNSPAQQAAPYVVLVSFDGFRYDYLDRGITPHLGALAARGARADGLVPIFPSKTFPNHYAIATGLHADRHGIATNNFWDDELAAFYRGGVRRWAQDARFYGGEPIWVTAEKQGMVTGSLFWIGGEAPVGGVLPSLYWPFDIAVTEAERLDALRAWLARPAETRPHLVALYFSLVDDAGHWHGPDSPEANAAIARADSIVGVLVRELAAQPFGAEVSLVIVSDHGMTLAREWLWLEDYLEVDELTAYAGPVAHLWFRGDSVRMERAYATLRAKLPAQARVFRRHELPREWRYDSARGGDLLVVPEEGWQVGVRRGSAAPAPAAHGYPPVRSMHGIFVAAGPRIRPGVRVPAFGNVHVYPLLAELLQLTPAATDGSADTTAVLLR